MLIHSSILLLLSNSITPRRDKSILYSRITIGIVLISTFIAYNNLALLALSRKKGIGIFHGLFHTTNSFHLLISTYITYNNLAGLALSKVIGMFAGLFHSTSTINTFNLFIFIPEELLSFANILALLFNL